MRSRAISTASRARLRALPSATGAPATSPATRFGARWSRSSPVFPCTGPTPRTRRSPPRTDGTSTGPSRSPTEHARTLHAPLAIAKRAATADETSVFAFVAATLHANARPSDPEIAAALEDFGARFQQLTAPVMAKGMEDTSFYRFNRLVSLNEVGGDPRSFVSTVAAFPHAAAARAKAWPNTMLATATHDTKRGEDVRTRIDALSEMPAGWRLALRRWRQL